MPPAYKIHSFDSPDLLIFCLVQRAQSFSTILPLHSPHWVSPHCSLLCKAQVLPISLPFLKALAQSYASYPEQLYTASSTCSGQSQLKNQNNSWAEVSHPTHFRTYSETLLPSSLLFRFGNSSSGNAMPSFASLFEQAVKALQLSPTPKSKASVSNLK